MITLASGMSYFDLKFLGVPHVIATAVLHGPGGVALIDPGPSSTLPALRQALAGAGIGMADVRTILLTHIHLDHAGSTGTLVHELPGLRVYVHEKGAPHMASPEKLLASATRLYGADMERLWGEFRAVPADRMEVLTGNERLDVAGQKLEVAYTPGHASHHVSYFSRDTGVAFVGDTAGIRRQNGVVLAPTPPPDIDLELWRASLARIGEWAPATLFLTHFGHWEGVNAHVAEMAESLDFTSALVKQSLARDEPDAAREAWFAGEIRRELRRRMHESDAEAYEVAARFDLSWRGLARYWRKRSGA
jgi:glyoxylase-like metal-dependent hydrolase (beta-lactamase superfamily II)